VAQGFAVWITGLPAAGKSTVARALARSLSAVGLDVEVLESDAWRAVLTPGATYGEEERDAFYGALVHVGSLFVRHGVPVIFDATGNRRAHRERGRRAIERFLEVYVDCPLGVCQARDPKGLYRQAASGQAATVPGVQVPYEPPEHPDVVIRGDRDDPVTAATRIMAALEARGWIPAAGRTGAGAGG